MSRQIVKNIDLILFIFLPVYPLIDFLILQSGFPIATTFFYIIFLSLNYHKIKIAFTPFVLIICYLICLLLNGIFYGWVFEYGMAIVLLLGSIFITFALFEKSNCYRYLISFTYLYFTLSIVIFFVRLIREGMNYYIARGGASFYGGNSGHMVLLLMFFMAVYLGKERDAIILFFMSNLNAILFSSKGAIAIQLIIFLYIIVGTCKFQLKQIFVIITGLLTIYSLTSWFGLDEVLQTRFMVWQNSIERGSNLFVTRFSIWEECIDMLNSDVGMIIIGCGLGKFPYLNQMGYSDPHNILLDVLFCSGIIGLILFIFILIRTLLLVSHDRFLFLLVIAYGLFEGSSLFFVNADSTLIWGTNLILLLCCYHLVREYNFHNNGETKV